MKQLLIQLADTVRVNKYGIFTLINILFSIGIYVNLTTYQISAIGIVLFLLFSIICILWLGGIFSNFNFVKGQFNNALSTLFYIYSIAFLGAFFIVFLKLSDVVIFIILLIVSVLISAANWLLGIYNKSRTEINNNYEEINLLNVPRIYIICLPLLFIIGFLLLYGARTSNYIMAPWEVIPNLYLVVILLSSFIILYLIFTKLKSTVILIIIILFSVLIHSYLPIIYEVGYGGDKWRHIATERYIAEGNVVSPSFLDDTISYKEFGQVKIPSVFLVGNKTSYANQWAITVIISKIAAIDIFWIDLVLVFLLWSLFTPILLYKIGKIVCPHSKIIPLLLSFSSTIFWVLQVYGAITVPYSFGHLLFIFAALVLLDVSKVPTKKGYVFIGILTLMLYLNYIIALVIWVLLLSIIVLYKAVKKVTTIKLSKKIYHCIIIAVGSLTISTIIISLDIYYANIFNLSSAFDTASLLSWETPRSLGRWILNIFGITQFGSIAASGTFFYNLNNIPQLMHWYPIKSITTSFIANLFLLVLIISGIVYLKIAKIFRNIILIFVMSFFLVLYIGSRYIINGPAPLSSRIDLLLYLFLLPLVVFGVYNIYLLANNKKIIVSSLAIMISIILLFNYVSGPVLRMVSASELKAMEYIYKRIKDETRYCVISDTWPLLALESISAKKIIGGGFTIGEEFSQPALVEIQQNLFRDPKKIDLQKALDITKTDKCYFVTEERWISDYTLKKQIELMGTYKKIDDIYIFEFNPETVR